MFGELEKQVCQILEIESGIEYSVDEKISKSHIDGQKTGTKRKIELSDTSYDDNKKERCGHCPIHRSTKDE